MSSPPEAALRVLIADEDEQRLSSLEQVVRHLGHEVIAHAVSVEEAARVIAEEDPAASIVVLHEDPEHALRLICEIVEYADRKSVV